MDNHNQTSLTPQQAADVVGWYHGGINHEYIERGWKGKVSIGQAAIWATLRNVPERFASGMNGPLLTMAEAGQGVEFLDDEQARAALYTNYMNTPPRSKGDLDHAERAAGEKLELEQ